MQPTFYFIGVSTNSSSIMKLFPLWMQELGFPDVRIEGVDLPLHASAERYRAVVQRIKETPHLLGGLVTTHKIDLHNAASDLFDRLDPYAQLCGEISCIAKKPGSELQSPTALYGFAKDPISAGQTLDEMLGKGYFKRTGGEVLCFGSGGAATAIALHWVSKPDQADRPRRFTGVDVSWERLEHLHKMLRQQQTDIEFVYLLNSDAPANDQLMAELPPHSLVINATGMGKDRPGSPVSDAGCFPLNGLVWELNYRGELQFLRQVMSQTPKRNLSVYDGWRYFLYGWTQHIAEALSVPIDNAMFNRLSAIADKIR